MTPAAAILACSMAALAAPSFPANAAGKDGGRAGLWHGDVTDAYRLTLARDDGAPCTESMVIAPEAPNWPIEGRIEALINAGPAARGDGEGTFTAEFSYPYLGPAVMPDAGGVVPAEFGAIIVDPRNPSLGEIHVHHWAADMGGTSFQRDAWLWLCGPQDCAQSRVATTASGASASHRGGGAGDELRWEIGDPPGKARPGVNMAVAVGVRLPAGFCQ